MGTNKIRAKPGYEQEYERMCLFVLFEAHYDIKSNISTN